MALDPLQRLRNEGLSILVFRGDTDLYSSSLPGVRPLLELVDWFPSGLAGAAVADRVVGGCAARIFALLGPSLVLGIRGSTGAEHILFAAGIEYRFEQTVPEIRSRDNSDVCPFEQLSAKYADAQQLIRAMRCKLAELRGSSRPPKSD